MDCWAQQILSVVFGPRTQRVLRWITIFSATLTAGCWRADSTGVITLDPKTSYQTLTGWEATAEAGHDEDPARAAFPGYKDSLFDAAVNDLGINRLRIGIASGAENQVDWYGMYINGQAGREVWRAHRYEVTNDNDDPQVINPPGFQWSRLDYQLDHVVLPIKQRLEARGEQLYINVTYTTFSDSESVHRSNPEEYAEFVLAVYQHMKVKYGFVPDAWEVILEPDNTPWIGTDIGRVIVAAGNRLKTNGFTPRFIAPSTTNMGEAISFFDQMMQVEGVLPFLSELSYHRYSGVSDTNLQAIADRAVQHRINTSMLELIGATHLDLHRDLKLGMNSAWQQFTLAYPADDNGAQYYPLDVSDPHNPKVTMGSRTKFLRQYFKYVRAGAQRIAAASSNVCFDPLAFRNTDGRFVVIVKTEGSGQFTVRGLATGTYGIKYTTPSQYDVDLPNVTITVGQEVTASIPERGVLTIYATSAEMPASTATRSPLSK